MDDTTVDEFEIEGDPASIKAFQIALAAEGIKTEAIEMAAVDAAPERHRGAVDSVVLGLLTTASWEAIVAMARRYNLEVRKRRKRPDGTPEDE